MATTTHGFPYPTNTGLVKDGAQNFNDLATTVDSKMGLYLVKTQTVGTGVTSVTVTNAFSSLFDNYKIIWSGGTCSSNVDVAFKLGSSISTYAYQVIYGGYATGTPSMAGITGAASWATVGGGGSTIAEVNMDIFQPYTTSYTNFFSLVATATGAGLSTGQHRTAASYTDFTLSVSSGTMSVGEIRVYGYRNP